MIPSFYTPSFYSGLLSEMSGKSYAIYPCVSRDEILIRNADALMNGEAFYQYIHNCIPDLDVEKVTICDVEYLLAIIKIAAIGESLDIRIKCPHCKNSQEYTLNLKNILGSLNISKWNKSVDMEEVSIQISPVSYRNQTFYDIEKFKLEKAIHAYANLEEQEKVVELFEKREKLELDYLCSMIFKVEEVTSKQDIQEWFHNIDYDLQTKVVNYIRDAINDTRFSNGQVNCETCFKDIRFPIDLDFCHQFRASLVTLSPEETSKVLEGMKKECDGIRNDLLKSVWFMRGAISYENSMFLTYKEREGINEIVKDNVELSKKMGSPIF